MKRKVALSLVLVMILCILCGCEENPNRATCTISATNGLTGVYCAFECISDQSSTYRATLSPIIVPFDEPGTLDYKFECPACDCLLEGTLTAADSVFLRCDCEEMQVQALVVSARFSENYDPSKNPAYERAP
jgi:hypothetical protein